MVSHWIVIVHYGEPTSTLSLLDHLRSTGTVDRFRILVVNNGPGDGAALRGPAHGGIDVVDVGRNIGYAGGVNLGLREARSRGARFVTLLTNDAIIDLNSLDVLAGSLEAHHASLAAPLITYQGGERVWADGLSFSDWHGVARNHKKGALRREQPSVVRDVRWITGCVMVLDLSTLGDLEFDEDYFLYYEDVDFCDRVRYRGLRIIVDGSITAIHPKVGETLFRFPPVQEYHMARSGLVYWKKRVKGVKAATYLLGYLAISLYRMVKAQSGQAALMALKGMLAGIRFSSDLPLFPRRPQ